MNSYMNSVSRYYLAPTEWAEKQLVLTGDEAHHCVRVLRAKVGDQAEVFDGMGRSAQGIISAVSKSEVVIVVESVLQQVQDVCPLELCQAIPKGGNMEWIVQKSVELGVQAIQPLVTENTVARAEQMEKKRQKWQRTALEACKQCGQNWLPVVLPPMNFREWIESRERKDFEIVAALDVRSQPIHQVCDGLKSKGYTSARFLIGPEGDFSTAEYDSMHNEGIQFSSIGDIVLKVETATLFCLSVMGYELRRP